MIDIGPRLYDLGQGRTGMAPGLGPAMGMGKRKIFDDLDMCNKRRRLGPGAGAPGGARLVDLQILSEDGAVVQEATIEEIWAPHATRLEIVVLDGGVGGAGSDTTFINLDDLGPLGGTSSLHSAILRESQQHAAPAAPATPAPHSADAADSDFGNLDWLINFKVDSVFEPKKRPVTKMGLASPKDVSPAPGSAGSERLSENSSPAAAGTRPGAAPGVSPGASPGAAGAAGTATQVTPPTTNRYSGPGKPPFTYTELIELALKDKGKLTVKEIYQWITKHFPFYQASDERWKNSVRHNLSINPHFRKESKAPQGAGHLWVVMDNNNKAKNSWKEERIQNFLASQIAAAEAAEASSSAVAKEGLEVNSKSPPSPARPPTPPSPMTTGAKSHSQLNTWWSERVSLERSAEEILSGVKREVGVEFLTPMDLDGDLDGDDIKLEVKDDKGFLYGDLTAEQVIAESGLQDELAGLYLLNDMTASITPDSLFPDDLNFGALELPLSG